MVGEKDLRRYLDKWDKQYWATYKVLDILQKVGPWQQMLTGLHVQAPLQAPEHVLVPLEEHASILLPAVHLCVIGQLLACSA